MLTETIRGAILTFVVRESTEMIATDDKNYLIKVVDNEKRSC